jgi:RNA polymerase sigma-70 factor, ECF subfamily
LKALRHEPANEDGSYASARVRLVEPAPQGTNPEPRAVSSPSAAPFLQLVPNDEYREAELVEAAIEGDETAFTELYDRHYDRIYRHVYYSVGRKQDAEDLTQQVFLQAWRAIGRFRRTSSPFVAWLLTIARNTVVSYYRHVRREHSLDSEIVEWPADEHIENGLEARLEHERVRRTLRHLRPEHQQVLTMRFLEDASYRELAATLGKTEANVRVIQHRALMELRRLLDEGA